MKKVDPVRVGTFGTHDRWKLFRLEGTFHSTIFTRSQCTLGKKFIISDNFNAGIANLLEKVKHFRYL